MKRIVVAVAVLMLSRICFAGIEEWKKMPSAPRLSDGTAVETTIAKVNKAIKILQSKTDLAQQDKVDLLTYVVNNSSIKYGITEAEYNQLKPYSDELDSLIGKNYTTAHFLYWTTGKDQETIAYCQEMIEEGKGNDGIYWLLFHKAGRIKDDVLRKEAATNVVKLTKVPSYIKTCLPYAAELSVDDYARLLNLRNDEITAVVLDFIQKKGDAKLCRDILNKVPYNTKVVASLKPFCSLYELSIKEQVEFYLLLWKANLASVVDNPEAKAIVDGAVTSIAQLLSLGDNPSISQVEKLLLEMK